MPAEDQIFPPRIWLPSILTAASIVAGFLSMIVAADGRFDASVYLLVLAIVLDTFDGRVARWLGATSEFGRELDSISDAVSSGAAPALLVYLAQLRPLGAVGIAVTVIYLLAGMYRLARYNLVSDAHSKARRTLGLPIPIGASYLMAVVLMRDQLPAAVAAGVALVAAAGMASRWKLPELKGTTLTTALLGVGILNYLTFVAWPNWYTVGWWNFWNLLIIIVARGEDRRLGVEATVGR
jgi:CDP-diacylglycerol--serine O-phosphatidyltransferase